jgi:AraC-like DNA-binding protein/mannose-6-phosphate isomerase-like protein (cupin superfamily)
MPNTKYLNFNTNYLALKKNAELVYAGKLSGERIWREKTHEHVDSCEIVLVVGGRGICHINGSQYPFEKGDILVYNEHVIHSEELRSEADSLNLYYVVIQHFSVAGMAENKLLPDGVSPVLSSRNDFSELKQMYEIILRECEQQEVGYDVLTNSLVHGILVKVLRLVNDQFQLLRNSKEYPLERQIMDHIAKNYMNNLSLKDLAQRFHISQYYLEHIFKEYTGESPINHLIRCRLDMAKKLLLTTDNSVTAIAQMTGYETVSYFCVAFKKATGMTPTQYQSSPENKPRAEE